LSLMPRQPQALEPDCSPEVIPSVDDRNRLRRSDFDFRLGENRSRTSRSGEDFQRRPGGKSARSNGHAASQERSDKLWPSAYPFAGLQKQSCGGMGRISFTGHVAILDRCKSIALRYAPCRVNVSGPTQ
jgi:hypothetical protein